MIIYFSAEMNQQLLDNNKVIPRGFLFSSAPGHLISWKCGLSVFLELLLV